VNDRILRIGSRGSPLALAQTAEARRRLTAAVHGAVDAFDLVVIRTTGDLVTDRVLAEVGGKGLFTKEIDEAMLDGHIDIAVHSAKDLPTILPAGIVLAAVLVREDVRDVFISRAASHPSELTAGAVVGTASLRRQAQLLARHPDLIVVPLRGNVQTRLAKTEQGAVAATLLALAGLRRLRLADHPSAHLLSLEDMLPAVGQGAIAITCRDNDASTRTLLAALDDPPTAHAVAAERAMLTVLDGSCRTPIAGLAEVDGASGQLFLRGLIARPDGSAMLTASRAGDRADAVRLGRDAGDELRRRAGPGFLG
jgi:hydroxymethylbilane synthase